MTLPVSADGGSGPAPTGAPEAPPDPGPRPRVLPSARDAVLGTCPYLTSAGGSWRATTPSRDHRCGAVDPPAAQTTEKQRRHCVSADHTHCTIYRAARDARATNLIAGADPVAIELADRRRRPIARTAPILLEPPRLVDQAVQFKLDRGPGQIALIGLMVVAFAVVALSRLAGGAAPVAAPSVLPSQVAVTPSRTPSPTVAPSPSITPSITPSASAAPTVRTTYKVVKGDTLLAIAKRFGTSPAKIRALNGMTSSTLRVGQVLKIP